MTKKLKGVLDSGPIIATFDRFSGRLHGYWKSTWSRGAVLVMPYVSSVALDLQWKKPDDPRDGTMRYYFRGNMHRWHGERSFLPKLAEHLTGADFKEVSFSTAGKPSNFVAVLESTANDVRKAHMCPSPEGDTPTSLRLFESLAAGCVPIVIGQANLTTFTLPFPSLIDYDEIAFFAKQFVEIVQ